MSDSASTFSSDLERLRIRDGTRKPARGRRRWPFVLLGVVVVVVILGFVLRPPEVQVIPAKPAGGGPAEEGGVILTANGYIEARHQTAVAARTTGRLAEVLVEEGDPVEKDQVVARLIDDDEQAGVRQAEANVALSKARLEQARAAEADAERRAKRRVSMLERKQISQEEHDTALTAAESARADRMAAEAGIRVAEAALDAARNELGKTRVTAPFSGVVLRKDAEVGEIVGPIMTSNTARAGAVVTIADMTTLEVGVDINESYIARISANVPADVVLDAHPEVHFPAEVRSIYPSADRDKATIPVRVRFLVEDVRIRPDLGAKVSFLLKRTTTDVVTVRKVIRVPESAIRGKNGQSTVWVVRNGRAEEATVTVGDKVDGEVEIASGINEGDQVIVKSPARLRRGMRVRVSAA